MEYQDYQDWQNRRDHRFQISHKDITAYAKSISSNDLGRLTMGCDTSVTWLEPCPQDCIKKHFRVTRAPQLYSIQR